MESQTHTRESVKIKKNGANNQKTLIIIKWLEYFAMLKLDTTRNKILCDVTNEWKRKSEMNELMQ